MINGSWWLKEYALDIRFCHKTEKILTDLYRILHIMSVDVLATQKSDR